MKHNSIIRAAAVMCLLLMTSAAAFSEPSPAPTTAILDDGMYTSDITGQTAASPYRVTFKPQSGWTSAPEAFVTVNIADTGLTGIKSVEYSTAGGWTDATSEYFASADGSIRVPVTDNGLMRVRVTAPDSRAHEETFEVRMFDRTPPAVSASIGAESLQVIASDDLSGVAGVQVNGLLFTDVTDGQVNIRIPDTLGKYPRLAVRAFDFAGNFSDPVTLDNPYCTPDGTATQAPTAYPATVTSGIPSAAPQPSATPEVRTEYVPIGPGQPYLADGNSHTLDCLYSPATNKQFLTLRTRAGNTFYLVIDYDKPVDENADMYETHFLNQVDERDLLPFIKDEDIPTPTPQIVYVTPEPTAAPPPASDSGTAKDKPNGQTGVIAIIVITALGGGALFFFLKKKKKPPVKKPSDEYSEDDDEETDSQ